MTSKTPAKLRIGVLFIGDVQFLDTACVDMFASASQQYLGQVFGPQQGSAGVASLSVEYVVDGAARDVAHAGAAGGDIVGLLSTSGQTQLRMTRLLTPEAARDGPLYDVVVIPGGDPRVRPSDDVAHFLRRHDASPHSDIITICSGVFIAAYAGVVAGKKATGPAWMVPWLRQIEPKAQWDATKRYVRDDSGSFWSSGAIAHGLDVICAYQLEKFDPKLPELICVMMGIDKRPAEYPQSELDFFKTVEVTGMPGQ